MNVVWSVLTETMPMLWENADLAVQLVNMFQNHCFCLGQVKYLFCKWKWIDDDRRAGLLRRWRVWRGSKMHSLRHEQGRRKLFRVCFSIFKSIESFQNNSNCFFWFVQHTWLDMKHGQQIHVRSETPRFHCLNFWKSTPSVISSSMWEDPISYFEREVERHVQAHKRLLEPLVCKADAIFCSLAWSILFSQSPKLFTAWVFCALASFREGGRSGSEKTDLVCWTPRVKNNCNLFAQLLQCHQRRRR